MMLPSASYRPLYPDVYGIREQDREANAEVTERPDRVFEFDLFTPEFARRLDLELRNLEAWEAERGAGAQVPNSMHAFGLPLTDGPFEPLLQALRQQIVTPLVRERFEDIHGASLDAHHGYVVDYANDRDLDLGLHVDDSHVTLNVCLGDDFAGAELLFSGWRCESHRDVPAKPEERFSVTHRPGRAVLHAGTHRHEVEMIESGRRRNLILWCRSDSQPTRMSCAPWCGAHPSR